MIKAGLPQAGQFKERGAEGLTSTVLGSKLPWDFFWQNWTNTFNLK
jgi:hypothetical protein